MKHCILTYSIVCCLAVSFKEYNFSYESRLRDQGAFWANGTMCQKRVTTSANAKGSTGEHGTNNYRRLIIIDANSHVNEEQN